SNRHLIGSNPHSSTTASAATGVRGLLNKSRSSRSDLPLWIAIRIGPVAIFAAGVAAGSAFTDQDGFCATLTIVIPARSPPAIFASSPSAADSLGVPDLPAPLACVA